MEILVFLLGLGCLVLIAWAMALVTGAVFGRQRRQPDQRHGQPSLQPTHLEEDRISQPTTFSLTSPAPESSCNEAAANLKWSLFS